MQNKILVKYNRLNIFTFGESKLIPGINKVDPKAWEDGLKLYPRLAHFVEDGTIETLNKSGVTRDDSEAANTKGALTVDDITKLNDKRAIKLVKDTADIDLLTLWSEIEKRKPVLAAIDAQFEAIAKAAEPIQADATK
jgi:hypothetical protein